MGMTHQQREKWAKTRQMGRARFVWLIGVAGWGLPTGILWSIMMAFMQGWSKLPLYLVLAVIGFPIGGYFFGQRIWKKGEENFRQANQSQ